MFSEPPYTVVVHHRSGIGDLIWHIPYLRAIAAASLGGKVSLIARPSCSAADVLAAESCINEVIEFDYRPRKSEGRIGRHDLLLSQLAFARKLRTYHFERIFIFSSRVRYALLALLAGIHQRAGFGFTAGERLLLNQPPYIRRYSGSGNWVFPEATAFCIAHGLVQKAIVPRMRVMPDILETAGRDLTALPVPRYAFSIGSSEPRKHWGMEHFAELAAALATRGGSVILLGGPTEKVAAENIIAAMPDALRNRVMISTQSSVQRSAALLRHCQYCVGNDTSVINMAVANGIPTLGLFGATPPLTHDPILQALVGQSMAAISVKAVLARLHDLNAPGLAP